MARFIGNLLFGVASTILSAIFTAAFFSSISFDPTGGLRSGSFVVALVLISVISGLAYFAYDYLMHARNGQTLGKMALKLRLVTQNGSKPDNATLLKRSLSCPGVFAVIGLLGFFSFFGTTVLYLLIGIFTLIDGIFVLTDTPLRRALHDQWTNTIVIKAQ